MHFKVIFLFFLNIKSIFELHNINKSDGNKRSVNIQVKDTFDQLDTDHDGVITREEFVNGCLNDEFLLYFLNPNIQRL